MNILVFNCGSSSLKYRLVCMPAEEELAGGEAQRIGPPTAEPARIVSRTRTGEQTTLATMSSHAEAFEQVMRCLGAAGTGLPDVVAHRVVHGGSQFHGPALIDEDSLRALDDVEGLAPLHNPPATRLIRACRERYPELPQVAIFDTAFHATIPEHARTYALPRRLRAGLGIRKYGFHGISHQYVATEAARFLGCPPDRLNAVSCHLGSGGASLCALLRGKSMDNTMGYSPLQGLVMSTRSGDLDPAVALRLLAQSLGNTGDVEQLLNRRSGILGLSGLSADIRDVLARCGSEESPGDRMRLTAEVYLWRLRKYLGAYLAVVGSAQAVIFTDTIGETIPEVRWAVCAGMESFGLHVAPERNRQACRLPADISADGSPVRILVIATNEELAIARYAFQSMNGPLRPSLQGVAS